MIITITRLYSKRTKHRQIFVALPPIGMSLLFHCDCQSLILLTMQFPLSFSRFIWPLPLNFLAVSRVVYNSHITSKSSLIQTFLCVLTAVRNLCQIIRQFFFLSFILFNAGFFGKSSRRTFSWLDLIRFNEIDFISFKVSTIFSYHPFHLSILSLILNLRFIYIDISA